VNLGRLKINFSDPIYSFLFKRVSLGGLSCITFCKFSFAKLTETNLNSEALLDDASKKYPFVKSSRKLHSSEKKSFLKMRRVVEQDTTVLEFPP